MPVYRYEAIDRTGQLIHGAMDAPTEADVNARVMGMGYRVQRVLPSSAGAATATRTGNRNPSGGAAAAPAPASLGYIAASAKENALFFRQFGQLVRSGMTVYQSLQNLGPRTRNSSLQRAAAEMAQAAHNGERISDAMARHPRLFPPHVVAGMRAGELGGFLEHVIDELATDYERETGFQRLLWLPKSLMVSQLAMVALAQPVFPNLFPEPHVATYLRLAFLRNLPIVAAVCVGYKLLVWLFAQPSFRARGDAMLLKVPGFADLARMRSVSAFVRTLGRLSNTSVGPIGSWEGAMQVAPNAEVRRRLQEAYGLVQQNMRLDEAFRATGLFVDDVEQQIATGVAAGQVQESLTHISEYYEGELESAYRRAKGRLWRFTIMVVIVTIGVALITLTKTYFDGIFHWVDTYFAS